MRSEIPVVTRYGVWRTNFALLSDRIAIRLHHCPLARQSVRVPPAVPDIRLALATPKGRIVVPNQAARLCLDEIDAANRHATATERVLHTVPKDPKESTDH